MPACSEVSSPEGPRYVPPLGAAYYLVDWRAAIGRAGRACCCPAMPAVVAIMPPAPGRPRPVELLLCQHHYRAGEEALAAAGAAVFGRGGELLTAGTLLLLAETGRQ